MPCDKRLCGSVSRLVFQGVSFFAFLQLCNNLPRRGRPVIHLATSGAGGIRSGPVSATHSAGYRVALRRVWLLREKAAGRGQ